MNQNLLKVLFSIGALIIASLACSGGGSNQGTIITPVPQQVEQGGQSASATSQEEQSSAVSIYEVGDLIEAGEYTIRLNKVEYQRDILLANFTIENRGSSDLSVSSLLSFSARQADGTDLDQSLFDCGASGLDGSVLPGDKLRGDICWSGARADAGIKIYYKANLFAQGAIVWNATEGIADAVDSGFTPSVVTFSLGDVIDVQSHTIRLNTVQYRGNVLFADFTIENYGDSDINLSSLLSLSARKSDGTKLSQEYFDCGTSELGGKVVPGDRLRGSICWNGAAPDDGIKIYYEASLLGQGAIVWDTVAGSIGAVDAQDAILKIDVYRVGNVIQIQDHTIVLNSVEFTEGVLKANFSIENSGSTDLAVSSIISFAARKRDGSYLQQEYFNCGSSLDGSVLPGDRLRGDICWKGANPGDGVKLYYDPNFLSSSAIVWVVD